MSISAPRIAGALLAALACAALFVGLVAGAASAREGRVQPRAEAGLVEAAAPRGAQPLAMAAASPAFRQALAEEVREDPAIAAFYRARAFAPLFTGASAEDAARRVALHDSLRRAPHHGLPGARYPAEALRDALADGMASAPARGRAEATAARLFLAYARDMQSGVLEPARVDPKILRQPPRRAPEALLAGIAGPDPRAFLAGLVPQSREYHRLLAEKMRLEEVRARGGWGTRVRAERLEQGDAGPAVVALRDRLIAMGYLPRRAQAGFDTGLADALRAFQADHGLAVDGIAGPATLAALNTDVDTRLGQVIVAMERERWLNLPDGLGARHVRVNLADFHTRLIDDGRVSFVTRSVVGARGDGKPTPEFSDEMEYMELNPTWTVPRGILGRDYLPRLKRNPGAASYLQVVDRRGRVVPRASVNFDAYTARSFPYSLVQPPGPRNALGTVKFMFPNPHAIYLHDTPDKHLFERARRTYSSGCIRLQRPHDFAYHLLARQSDNPEALFQGRLATGQRTRIALEETVPVHLTYRTAFTQPRGRVQYREDIYGRDAALWQALQRAGVSPGGAPG